MGIEDTHSEVCSMIMPHAFLSTTKRQIPTLGQDSTCVRACVRGTARSAIPAWCYMYVAVALMCGCLPGGFADEKNGGLGDLCCMERPRAVGWMDGWTEAMGRRPCGSVGGWRRRSGQNFAMRWRRLECMYAAERQKGGKDGAMRNGTEEIRRQT
ncbi:hypothetical protein IWZ00DRAFT_72108 [Phyllosticta capitalensis]